MNELIKEIKGYMEKTNYRGDAWGNFLIRSAIRIWELDLDENQWNMTEEKLEKEFKNILNQVKEAVTVDDYPVGEKFWKSLTKIMLDYDYCKIIGISVPGNSCSDYLISLMETDEEKDLLDIFLEQWKSVTKGGEQK